MASSTKLDKFRQIAKSIASSFSDEERQQKEEMEGMGRQKSFHRKKTANASTIGAVKNSNSQVDFVMTERHYSNHSSGEEGEGSDAEGGGVDTKKKGLVYQKTENFWTRVRDMIAMSDVFISRKENPPFVSCLQGWHFTMMTLAMYGFMLSYLSSGSSPRTKLAGISLSMTPLKYD